jgi:hypothetical protein
MELMGSLRLMNEQQPSFLLLQKSAKEKCRVASKVLKRKAKMMSQRLKWLYI